jgi:hypothetical protein
MDKEGRESKKDVLNVTVNVEAIASAVRNADNLDDLALEIETVNPKKITLEQEIYTLKSQPANDKKEKKGKKLLFASPRVVGVRSIIVNSLTTEAKEGHITINGTLDVPRSGRRVVKLEECLFVTEEDARAVARVVTEVELERAQSIRDEAQEAVDFIKKQIEDDRF